jgi:SAM-dependent methyltransferase
MCHPSVLEWARSVLTPADAAGRQVLEVGSLDVNGSVRPIIEAFGPRSYVGTDVRIGPGVNHVIDVTTLARFYGADRFELVVSTEMLEHAADWRGALANMAVVLAPGGVLVLTTRSPGFPYHYPPDHWRYTPELIGYAMAMLGLRIDTLIPDPQHPGVFVRATKPADGRLWSVKTLRRALEPLDAIVMQQEVTPHG